MSIFNIDYFFVVVFIVKCKKTVRNIQYSTHSYPELKVSNVFRQFDKPSKPQNDSFKTRKRRTSIADDKKKLLIFFFFFYN